MSVFFSETQKHKKIQYCFDFKFVLQLNSCPIQYIKRLNM